MARKPSARVVYNRQAADALMLGVADGLLAVGESIIDESDPPDAEPFGRGLVTTGGAIAYVNGKKVGGTATKPRREKLPPNGVAVFVGFGFPGRFQELGTIKQPARPFFSPAVEAKLPGAEAEIKPHVARRLAGVR